MGLARMPHSQKKRCRRRLKLQRGVAKCGVLTLGSNSAESWGTIGWRGSIDEAYFRIAFALFLAAPLSRPMPPSPMRRKP